MKTGKLIPRLVLGCTGLVAVLAGCSHYAPVALHNMKLPFRTVASSPEDYAGGRNAKFFLPRRESQEAELSYVKIFAPNRDFQDAEVEITLKNLDGIVCLRGNDKWNVEGDQKILSYKISGAESDTISCATENVMTEEAFEDTLSVGVMVRKKKIEHDNTVKSKFVINDSTKTVEIEYEILAKTLENLKNNNVQGLDMDVLERVYFMRSHPLQVSGQWFYRTPEYRKLAGSLAAKEKNTKKKNNYLADAEWTVEKSQAVGNVLRVMPGEAFRFTGVSSAHNNNVKLRRKLGETSVSGNAKISDVVTLANLEKSLADSEAKLSDAKGKKKTRLESTIKRLKEEIVTHKNRFAFPEEELFSLLCAVEVKKENGVESKIILRGATLESNMIISGEENFYPFCQINDIARKDPKTTNHYEGNSGSIHLEYQVININKAIAYLEGMLNFEDATREEMEKKANIYLGEALGETMQLLVGESAAASRERIKNAYDNLRLTLKANEERIVELQGEIDELKKTGEIESSKMQEAENKLLVLREESEKLKKEKANQDAAMFEKSKRVSLLDLRVAELELELEEMRKSIKKEGVVTENAKIDADQMFPVTKKLRGYKVAEMYEIRPLIRELHFNAQTGARTYTKEVTFSQAAPVYAYEAPNTEKGGERLYHVGAYNISRMSAAMNGNVSIVTKQLVAKDLSELQAVKAELKSSIRVVTFCVNEHRDTDEVRKFHAELSKDKSVSYEEIVSKIEKHAAKGYGVCADELKEGLEKGTIPLLAQVKDELSLKRVNFNFTFELSEETRKDKNGATEDVLFVDGSDVSACYEGLASYGGGTIFSCESVRARGEYHPFFSYKALTNYRVVGDLNATHSIRQNSLYPVWLAKENLSFPLALTEDPIFMQDFVKIPNMDIIFQ
jgi:hypothetical protein